MKMIKYKNLVTPITDVDLDALHVGTWILGTGGGGDPYQKYINMKQLYAQGHTAYLLDPECVDDNDIVGILSMMGAPIVAQERLDDPYFATRPVDLMESYLKRPFDAVMSLEIGGGNGIHPFKVGCIKGIPVLDADCMGRAYPTAPMTSFAVAGLPMYPFTMCDIRHNEIIVPNAESWHWLEKITRPICAELGAVAATCKAPRTGAEVKKYGLKHTVSKAIKLGNIVLDAGRKNICPIDAVLENETSMLLFQGKVHDVNRRVIGGYLKGKTLLNGVGTYKNSQMTLHFQNEFSVAEIDTQVIATTPDLICVLDTQTGAGVGTDTMRYGQRLSVIAMPADPIFTTPKGLQNVGPQAFGFDVPFISPFQ